MLRAVILCAVLAALSACGAGRGEDVVASRNLAEAAYVHDGPPSLTLVTMINNRTGKGGHSGLLINGSQRVLFDPAGSFRVDWILEQGDVLYGMTPRNFNAYKSAHARATHHVVTQEITVSPEVAERALALAIARGNVPSAFCANATSTILRTLPGFQDIDVTFFPERLMEQVAQKSGVVTDRRFEDDAGNIHDGVEAVRAAQPG